MNIYGPVRNQVFGKNRKEKAKQTEIVFELETMYTIPKKIKLWIGPRTKLYPGASERIRWFLYTVSAERNPSFMEQWWVLGLEQEKRKRSLKYLE